MTMAAAPHPRWHGVCTSKPLMSLLLQLFMAVMIPAWAGTDLCAGELSAAHGKNEYLADSLEANIRATGLTAVQVRTIRENAFAVVSADQLAKTKGLSGYILGVDAPDGRYWALARETGLIHYEAAYKKFGIGLGDSRHTDTFMDTVTRSGERIYFLVPANLWIHPEGMYTKREMWWLLTHPERLEQVTFVFGT